MEQVLALAPDGSSRRAARGLARPGPWLETGSDGRIVWGSCRGGAREPYQVLCDTAVYGYRCTCPSRKQPCKHVLALLLLWAEGSPVMAGGPVPADVAAWVAGRPAPDDDDDDDPAASDPGRGRSLVAAATAAAAVRVEVGDDEGADDSPRPAGSSPQSDTGPDLVPEPAPDPAVAAARLAVRAGRIAAGMAELELWLGDLLRHGFGWAASQPYGYWDEMAARLVDAQAPGAAARVRNLGGVVHTGEGWPARLLGHVARLHLLAAGWARYDDLPEATRADLRTAAGWPWPGEQVLAGPREIDRWYVLARVASDDPQLRVQRTWLWGLEKDRPALIVDFARPGRSFAWELWPGQAMDAAMARYPGSAPLRVLVADRLGDPVPGGPPPGWADLEEMTVARSRALVADPWTERWPVSVREVVPERAGGGWTLTDRGGRRMDLTVAEPAGWRLVAVAGGRPVHVVGEWGDDDLFPLGVWDGDRMYVL